MNEIKVKARAKVNLALDVVGKRADGYHDLRMVMQTLSLADDVSIRTDGRPDRIEVTSNIAWLPKDGKNLAYRAARLLMDKFGITSGVSIDIFKKIPVSAGLGGGSADCAAVLSGMNGLFGLGLGLNELMELGATLGSDVPFCLFGGTALAEGVGERLTRLRPAPKAFVTLVKPPFSVSTPEVFRDFNPDGVREGPDIDGMIGEMEKGSLEGVCGCFGNTLESVTVAKHPVLKYIKEFLRSAGAVGSLMSGSGPTVFGVFETRPEAIYAAEQTEQRFRRITDTYITEFYNSVNFS